MEGQHPLAVAAPLESGFTARMQMLEEEEARLTSRVAAADRKYAGLRDLDDVLELVDCRVQIALAIVSALATSRTDAPRLHQRARESAQSAIALLDELLASGISDDQREAITEHQAYSAARRSLETLILRGGGSLLEPEQLAVDKSRLVAEIVTAALRKHAALDDRYRLLFRAENLPSWLRALVRMVMPVLAAEYQPEPPYGIEEGQEETLTAERLKLPLSQAILYVEEELLPPLRQQLQQDPGSVEYQAQISQLEGHVLELKRLRFIPRATPIVIEHGFYTNSLGGYTADGELLVSVPLAISYRSGTNLDRASDMIKQEITRRLAGKRVSATLDASYLYLRSLQSGMRGSSRTPSMKLDAQRGFQLLKREIPLLRQVDNKADLQRLLDFVSKSKRRAALRMIETLINNPRAQLATDPVQ
jgi:hypothetical protein